MTEQAYNGFQVQHARIGVIVEYNGLEYRVIGNNVTLQAVRLTCLTNAFKPQISLPYNTLVK
jgi:hypothetical protein